MRTWVLSRRALVVILRWLLCFVTAYLVAAGDGRRSGAFVTLLGLFAASNLALGVVPLDLFRRWRLNYVVVGFDVAFISAAIWLTGDLDLYIFYFFTILMSSFGRQVQGSIVTAVVASVVYAWMSFEQGRISSFLSPSLLIRLPFFYLVALMSSFMADESREEQERLDWTNLVLGMTQDLGACRDRAAVTRVLGDSLGRLPGVSATRVFFGGPDGWRTLEGERRWTDSELGLPGDCGAALEPVLLSPLGAGAPGGPHPPGAASAVVCPYVLRRGGRGVLVVYARRLDGFRERMREIFGIAALSLARSLDNIESFEEIERRSGEVDALMEVNRAINSTLDLREVLQRVMAESTRFVGAEASSLMLIDEKTEELVFEVATGEKGQDVRQFRLKVGEGVAGWTAREGCPLIVNDPRADPRFASKVDSGTGFQTRNLMAVPLRVRERIIGVLEVVNRIPPGPFEGEHLRLLEAVAAQAGTAIEKARLYAYMEEQVNETIQMYLSLEKEKGKVETILASMIEGVIVADEAGEVTLVTASARRALSPDGVRWTPEYERVTALLRRAVGERAEFGETIAPDLPGRRMFGVRVAPMLTGAGKLLGAVAVLEDVTELTRLSELKSEFISQVSHEMRTPLTSMRAAVNLVLRERAGPLTERQRELGALMRDEAERMTALINDLLDISKIEAGMIRLQLEEIEPAAVVGRLLAGMSALLAERGVRTVSEFPPGLGTVRADQRRFERVFTNLVSNAVKYSPPGSTVVVGAAPWEGEGGGLRFWVRDNGPGIPEADRTRIFEKFQRGTDVAGVQGTGLGLAIARGVVEEHGGRIWVESGSGEGSTFCFTIPRAGAGRSGGEAAAPSGANEGGGSDG